MLKTKEPTVVLISENKTILVTRVNEDIPNRYKISVIYQRIGSKCTTEEIVLTLDEVGKLFEVIEKRAKEVGYYYDRNESNVKVLLEPEY